MTPRSFLLLGIMSLSLGLGSCSTGGGGGGGKSMFEPSDQQINKEAEKAYADVKSKATLSTNARWNEMVQRVGTRIAKASGENFKWEVILIEGKEVNAWCMPGGKMAVYTGIMPVLQTEGALAAVMGHEVAHATKRHGREGYARAMKGQLAGLAVAVPLALAGQFWCKSQACKVATLAGAAASGFAVTFFQMKFSRGDETEADQAGQIYMAKAGYDPSEAARVWERMSKASGGKGPPEILSTHPANAHRRDNLTKWLPEAQAEYARSSDKRGIGENI